MYEQVEEKNINVGRVERWLSGIGGAMLVLGGLRRRSWTGLLMSLGGAALAYRGVSGRCPMYRRLGINSVSPEASRPVEVERSVFIERSPHEVYRFWRTLENLPRFMKHIDEVTQTGERTSHWVAHEGPYRMEWDAEIVEDVDGQCIAWRAVPGGDIYTEGSVYFQDVPDRQRTEARVRMSFAPPAGIVGRALAPFLSRITARQLEQDLERLERAMASGEGRVESIEAQVESTEPRRDIGMGEPARAVPPVAVGPVGAPPMPGSPRPHES